MRWVFGRGGRACGACGEPTVRDAVWCGACGASLSASSSLADAGDDVVLSEALAANPAVRTSGEGGRRVFAALVVVVLAGAIALNTFRYAPGDPVLGGADTPTGMSSTGPPPEGLQLAWSHELPSALGGSQGVRDRQRPHVVARDGRVRVDELVVDVRDGRVTASLDWNVGFSSVVVDDGVLVTIDNFTGDVTRGPELGDDLMDPAHPVYAERQIDAMTVLVRSTDGPAGPDSGPGESIVIDEAGEVLGMHEGRLATWIDHLGPGAAVLPLRSGESPERSPVEVMDLATGTLVHRSPEGQSVAVSATDGTALIAATGDDVGRQGGEAAWTLTVLHEPGPAPPSSVTELSSGSVPRLVGRWGERVLVGATTGRDLSVHAIDRSGRSEVVAEATVRSGNGGGLDMFADVVLGAAAVVDGLLVVVDIDDETVTALASDGDIAWRVDVEGAESLGADDDVVVVGSELGDDRWLLDAGDGSTLLRLPVPEEDYERMGPAVAVGGAVGVAHGYDGRVRLQRDGAHPLQMVWLDGATGDETTFAEVVETLTATSVPPDATLHGTVLGADGGRWPIITQQPGTGLRLLLPDQGFVEVALPPRPPDAETYGGYEAVVGIVSGHLVVGREQFGSHPSDLEPPRPVATVFTVRLDTLALLSIEDSFVVAVGPGVILTAPIESVSGRSTPTLSVVDPVDGTELWRMPWEGWPEIVVGDGTLVAVDTFELASYDPVDGRVRWQVLRDRIVMGDGVVTSQHLVEREVGTTVVARDLATGEVAWRAELGALPTTLTAAGDHVVVGTKDGAVVHLDALGHEVQRIEVGTSRIDGVAVIGDTVVVTADGHAHGLRRDGTGIVERDEVDLP